MYSYDSFDAYKDLAISVAKIFSMATGLEVSIINVDSDVIFSTSDFGLGCEFCHHFRNVTDSGGDCLKSMLYGSYQAERFGGKYVFFCPRGFTHFASPIISDSQMIASFVAGPCVMTEPNEQLHNEIESKYNLDGSVSDTLKRMVNEIPYIPPRQVEGMSEMLKLAAVCVSDSYDTLNDRDESLKQHSDISGYIHSIKSDDSKEDIYPIETEKQLLAAITSGNKPEAQALLNEILGYILYSSGAQLHIIKARVLELVVLLSRAAMHGGADAKEVFGLNYQYINEIDAFSTIEDITLWLAKIMNRFTDCVFNLVDVKHIDVIYKAMDYVKRNYMNKITLEEVADYVYLSPAYFSKIFKEELNTTFNSYLNNVRIEKSKTLLLDDSINLIEVSSLSGYEDQSYFSKVFKKITGISPGKYRETRGKQRIL